jgi:hypothetical protein
MLPSSGPTLFTPRRASTWAWHASEFRELTFCTRTFESLPLSVGSFDRVFAITLAVNPEVHGSSHVAGGSVFKSSKRFGIRPAASKRFKWACLLLFCSFRFGTSARAQITTSTELVAAVNAGAPNSVVVVAAGTFELTAPLRPKSGMKIRGAGAGRTIITNAASWAPGITDLTKDEGAQINGIRCDSYLVSLPEKTINLTISDLTFTGPKMHGAICGVLPDGLELARLEFKDFLWSGVRIFIAQNIHIHDNTFIDSGGKSEITQGSSGGGVFLTYVSKSEIDNNRFRVTPGRPGDYYGIKGREAREMKIHHNTIATDFAIEFPFEGDWTVDIHHNYLGGTISVPKYGGGPVPDGGYTFHVHHNYFTSSYSFEYQRNAVEIDHNLFDFSTAGDYGNLVAGFDVVPADPGGTKMHDNLIRNPGRGIYWNEGVYNNFWFYNNHVIGQTTVTPRTEGLFDFRPNRNGAVTDWNTIQIRDNIIELTGTARPLMRNAESLAAVIENNTFINLSDSALYQNSTRARTRGPTSPLLFRLGAEEELTVCQWTLASTDGGACETRDGGTNVDAGTADAGETGADAGHPFDAGIPLDAGQTQTSADGGRIEASGPVRGSGCGCETSTAQAALVLVVLSFSSRIRRPVGTQRP